MAKPNDPYLVAIPPVPLLALATTLDIKPAGYFHREVFAQTAVDYGGTDGTHLLTNFPPTSPYCTTGPSFLTETFILTPNGVNRNLLPF